MAQGCVGLKFVNLFYIYVMIGGGGQNGGQIQAKNKTPFAGVTNRCICALLCYLDRKTSKLSTRAQRHRNIWFDCTGLAIVHAPSKKVFFMDN